MEIMAKKGPRATIKLESPDGDHSYFTEKNSRNTPDKMKRRKFNPRKKKHEIYTEGKMK